MLYDSLIISDQDSKASDNEIATWKYHAVDLNYTIHYISTVFVGIQQLQTDLTAQHQYEKHALAELNQSFRIFLDRVQQLELQNAKYVALLSDFRRQSSSATISNDTESDEHYLRLQSDLMTVKNGKVDYQFEFELFRLQIGIYKELIDIEQEWKDERRLKLEYELNQSSSVVINVRTSYEEMQREIESLHAAREDTYQQYLTLTRDWCHLKKQTNEQQLSFQMLKDQMIFYKNLRSYSVQSKSESLSDASFDVKQSSMLELDKTIKKIRHDFEQFYDTVHREMNVYYTTKMEQMEIEVQKEFDYQRIEINKGIMNQEETLQNEYEKVQKTHSYEKEVTKKLETMHSQLESEFQSIQLQNYERSQAQSKDLHSLQESIMAMTYDIEEMRRRKISLESEIIVYRNLLNSNDIREYHVTFAPVPSVGIRLKTMNNTNSDHTYDDNDDASIAYSSGLIDVGTEFFNKVTTSALNLSSSDVRTSIAELNLNAGLDGVGINTPLGNLKLDPTSSCLENVDNIAKTYLINAATSALGLSSPDVSASIAGLDLNAGLDGVGINTPLGDFKLDANSSCLENVNNIAKTCLINATTSALGLSSSDVSASIGGLDLNAALDRVGINTPLGNIKIDPTSSCTENVNNIAKTYLINATTSALGLSSPDVSASIGGLNLNAALDGVGINTALGNIKIDPTSSCTENVAVIVTGFLGEHATQEIDQFCSNFNDAARMQAGSSLYSDGTTALLSCQANAGATIGKDGVKANAQADGSISKHKYGDTDINVLEGQAYAKASIGADGLKAVVGGELNVVSLKNDNVQASLGLSAKTGVGVSTTDVSASIVGLGFNAGVSGVGLSTPVGSINLKPW